MKKTLKILGFVTLGILAVLYLTFLFILPNVINLNDYKEDLQKIAKDQVNLNLDFENPKIITTPLLGAGIKADNISIKLPDDSLLFSADNFKTRISIPSIFLLTVKVSCLEINNPFINLEIENDKNFKIIKLVEDILNTQKEQKLEEDKQTVVSEASGFAFNPAWIRIKVPCVKINNYKLLINDLKSKHYLDINGKELKLAYLNGKIAKVKTYAELYSDKDKNITANIDINTFLPKAQPKLDSEDDPAERIELPFINPVTMYRNYDLKANLDTKLRIRNHKGDLTSYGYFNINGMTLKVSHLQLPESYLNVKTFGQNATIDTNVYAAKDQNISLLGKLNYGKHPKMDMNIKTGTIKFNDMLILGKAFLDSLHIYNELGQVSAEGTLNADCYIKTNFKKLKSNGSVIVKNGGIAVKGIGKVLSNSNINIILDNNILDIQNSSLKVANSPVFVNGKIDEKSIADITIKADRIPLPALFNAFAPRQIKNEYKFRSADATFDIGIQGKLKNAIATAKFGLSNLNIGDRLNNFVVKDGKFAGDFSLNSKNLVGKINNENFLLELPKTRSQIFVPKLDVEIANNNITIAENTIGFNEKSVLKYSGEVIDYNKLKSIKFNTEGDVSTDDIIKLIGREFKKYIHSQGSIPVKLSVEGDKKKQTILVQALGNKNNFITPVDFANTLTSDTSLQSVIDLKPGRIKIKKTGLFTRKVSIDEKGNEVITLDEVLGIDGTIAGDTINLIKITIPKPMEGKIHVFPQSSFTLTGRGFVFGKTNSPRLRGGFNIQNLSIPELLTSIENMNIGLRGQLIAIDLRNLILNGSDIQSKCFINIAPSSKLIIPSVEVSSRLFNLDKVMKVSDRAMKYVPQTPASSSASSQSADIPITIQNGTIDFRRLITGNIDVRNTTGRISLDNNVFFLRNMRTNVFKGNVNGNISVNLISMLMNIKLDGENIDVAKALLDAAGMKDMLSGKAKFSTDISLSGATYEEQMRTLKGNIDFDITDGQFGPFGKIENLIIAENIRESQFFQTAMGGVINSLTSIDTTHFSELSGHLVMEEGVCHIDPITSLGNVLSLHIFGDFDILKNYADMKVRARMSSIISKLLGPLNAINPINIMNSAASLNVVTAKAFSLFCEVVPADELETLPSFANKYVDSGAAKFQLKVKGDAAKPLTLVKSFKWLTSQAQFDAANDFVNSLPEEIEGSTATNIEEAIAEAKALEAEKKTVKYKLRHLFDSDD